MKTIITICLAVFLVLGFSGVLLAQQIPGGVVYSDGKEIVYYDFRAFQKTSLTADLKKIIKGPAAISGDGKTLVWLENARFWMRQLPYGKPFLTLTRKNKDEELSRQFPEHYHGPFAEIPDVVPAPPQKLSLSSNGYCFAYEIKALPHEYAMDPNPQHPDYRNQPPVDFVVISPTGLPFPGIYQPGPLNLDEIAHRTGYSMAYGDPSGAFLPAWSKQNNSGDSKFAFLEKKNEIRSGPFYFPATTKIKIILVPHPRREAEFNRMLREIPLLPNGKYESLAWKPDDTITYLSDGTLYSEKSEVIAQGIKGTGLTWVSDEEFIFRGKDGGLYVWTQGNSKKILVSIPETFSFCRRSPFAPEERVTEKANNTNAAEEKELSGITRFCPDYSYPHTTDKQWFKVGGISVCPQTLRAWDPNLNQSGVPSVASIGTQGGTKFAWVTETEISEIKDPSKYNYQIRGHNDLSSLNEIVLIKSHKNEYAAIKLISVEPKYKSKEEWPKAEGHTWEDYQNRKVDSCSWYWVTCEWKYWPKVPSGTPDQKQVTEPVAQVQK